MIIYFYFIHQSFKKRTIPTRDMLSGRILQEVNEVSHITSDKKSL